jgi:hypothetical protein
MKKFLYILPFAAMILAIVVFTNCSKESPTEPITTDAAYFTSVVTGNDATTSDLILSDYQALDESAQLQALKIKITKELAGAAITPLHWGRVISSASRTITKPTVTQADTVAIVAANVTFTGNFVIQALSGADTVVIKKPFTESLDRNLKFVRVARTKFPRLNWALDAVSIAAGGTDNPAISITQVELVAPNNTFTVTDPLSYYMQIDRWWMPHHFPVLQNASITLRVTVQSAQADTDIVTLHYAPGAFGLHNVPFTMTSETNNGGTFTRVYEKTWTVSGSAKKFASLMVSATTKASLYNDDLSNFSSVLWGIPYKTSQ